MIVRGQRELNRRLRALATVPEPMGRRWATLDVQLSRRAVPTRTGKTRASFRVAAVNRKHARVSAAQSALFIDRGTRPHPIRPAGASVLAWKGPGGPRFAPRVQHPGSRPRPFRERVAIAALKRGKLSQEYVRAWNRAA